MYVVTANLKQAVKAALDLIDNEDKETLKRLEEEYNDLAAKSKEVLEQAFKNGDIEPFWSSPSQWDARLVGDSAKKFDSIRVEATGVKQDITDIRRQKMAANRHLPAIRGLDARLADHTRKGFALHRDYYMMLSSILGPVVIDQYLTEK